MKVEILVLNYNGADLLSQCLPSVIQASRATAHACTVTVIDNNSSDESVSLLENNFKDVKIVAKKDNRVLCAFNDVVKESVADIVVLLNNDLKVEPDFLEPLLNIFDRHEDAFLAAPMATTPDGGQYEGSLSKTGFHFGFPWAKTRFKGYEKKINLGGHTMTSGFGAFRKDLFVALGGYDDLYLPGTVEDLDICFRAWRAGYACYYAPESRVYHIGQATFKKYFSRVQLASINQRNLCLFMWKNITDPLLWIEHLICFVPRIFYFLMKGRVEFLQGAFWALGRLPQALRRRCSRRGLVAKRGDREIYKISEEL